MMGQESVRLSRTSMLAVAGGLSALALGTEAVVSGPSDTGTDAVHAVLASVSWVLRPLRAVPLAVVGCLVLVVVLYHLASAVAARAAAGVRLPGVELVAAQYAVSAANRITPAGLGGATLLGRYLCRRGGMRPSHAAAAMSALAVLGAMADLVAFAVLLALGAVLGAGSMTSESPELVARLVGLVSLPTGVMCWILSGAVAVTVPTSIVLWRRAPDAVRRGRAAVVRFGRELVATTRSPGRLAVLLSASAATTLVLAAGFAATAVMIPAGLPVHDFGALMIGYMIGAAAGGAMPTPGGIGSTEAALVGVLVAASMPTAVAVAVVIVFRAITFWAPAAIGLLALPVLRRRGAV